MKHSTLTLPDGWLADDRPAIALVTHSARLSGAELMLCRMAPHLQRFKPIVVIGESGPLETELISRGVAVLRMPLPAAAIAHSATRTAGVNLRRLPRQIAESVRYARRLAKGLREVGAEVIYTHSAKAHLYGGLAGRIAGLPVVLHSHTIVNRGSMRTVSVLAARAGAAILPHAVIANSGAGRRSLGWFANRRPSAVIPPPVDVPASIRTRRDRTKLRFVVAGRICPGKNQALAIEAFARVKPRLGRDSELVIVGAPMFNDDERYADTLPQLAEDLGVAADVRFLGHHSDPAEVLAASDVLVHAATEQEGFGQVIAEALAVGTPAIVPADGGPGEIVADGVDGILYQRGDLDSLTAAILRLAHDPIARAQMGERARDAAQRFDLGELVARTDDFLYEQRRRRRRSGDAVSGILVAKGSDS